MADGHNIATIEERAEAIADLKASYDDPEDCCGMCLGPIHESGFCPSCKECVA